MAEYIDPYQFELLLTCEEIESLQRRARQEEEHDEHHTREGRMGHTRWCECSRCPEMPTTLECVCCRELHEAVDKMGTSECITALTDFENVCLNREVLRTALVAMIDVRGDDYSNITQNKYIFIPFVILFN